MCKLFDRQLTQGEQELQFLIAVLLQTCNTYCIVQVQWQLSKFHISLATLVLACQKDPLGYTIRVFPLWYVARSFNIKLKAQKTSACRQVLDRVETEGEPCLFYNTYLFSSSSGSIIC